jgi:predicted dehydrogenase
LEARDDVAERCRVAIAGLDHWYVGLAAAEIAAHDPAMELVAIAHRDADRLAETAARYGSPHTTSDYKSVVDRDDVDVVVTACPTSENADLVVAAANAGKHIVSVKPIAMNLVEADRIVAAVRKNRVRFVSNESPYRTFPAVRQIREWLDAGRLGRAVSAYTVFRAPLPRQGWPGTFEDTWWLDPTKSPGGGWIDHAIYHIDVLRWLFASEVRSITGVTANLVHRDLRQGMEDFGVANVIFDGGQVAVIEVSWTATVGGRYEAFHLVGTEGQAVSDPTTTGKVAVTGKFEIPGWFQVDAGPPSYSMLPHLVDALQRDVPGVADVNDARANLAACMAFYDAARISGEQQSST